MLKLVSGNLKRSKIASQSKSISPNFVINFKGKRVASQCIILTNWPKLMSLVLWHVTIMYPWHNTLRTIRHFRGIQVKMQNLNPIMRRHRPNPCRGTVYKMIGQYFLEGWKARKHGELSQSRGNLGDMTTKDSGTKADIGENAGEIQKTSVA